MHRLTDASSNSSTALLLAAAAPCISAPIWEEALYRGFCLPLLSRYLSVPAAVCLSSLLFASHHLNIETLLPLSALGALWAQLYIHCNNLLVPIAMHAMWNLRVFISCFLYL